VEEVVDLQEMPTEAEQKEIKVVLAHQCMEKNKFEFHICYCGFTMQHNEWEHEKDMKANMLLECYWQVLQLRCSMCSKCRWKSGQ
jgi:hypothetical protein